MFCVSWHDGMLGKMITGMDGTGPASHPLPPLQWNPQSFRLYFEGVYCGAVDSNWKKKTFASLPDVSKWSERFTNSQTWGWYSLAKSYKVIIFSHPHIERFRHKNQGTDLSYLQLVRKRDQWGNSASTIACEILCTNADRKLHSKAASMFFKIQIRIRFKSVSLFSDSAMWGSRASLALISSSVKWDHDPPL